eukprot:TRINITY_DN43288_c0_g1_i1.p1 TRINITY_DN43288_c0_g1~~TRINITY_DN43288_c0_g1_i1.p1  ORF type:complete len:679 (+),score=119.97 TRINITY_DN43288_c0_g1_i1:277-2037(+)
MTALLKDPFPEKDAIMKFYPQNYHGVTKQGWPLYIERPGFMDMPRLLQALTPERLLEFMVFGSELSIRRRLPACSLARGELVDKSMNIMDLENLGFRVVTHATARRVLKEFTTTIQNHYPETMGRTIIINAPRVFGVAWSFVKPMLDEKTVNKIAIFGPEKETWMAALLEYVEASQLPSFLGGTCVCDGRDPLSCMRCAKGPWEDPGIQRLLDEYPLCKLLSPEVSKIAQAQIISTDDAKIDTTAEDTDAPPAPEKPAPATAGTLPTPVPTLPRPSEPQAREAVAENSAASPELSAAESELAKLVQEVSHLESVHMQTLTAWVREYNEIRQAVGHVVIERAQDYYDSLSVWQQAVLDFATQQDEVARINKELEIAIENLSKAENAFAASVGGSDSPLSEEEWQRLAPLDEERLKNAQNVGMYDSRLLRSFRVATLGDKVICHQQRRDAQAEQLQVCSRELDRARERHERTAKEHKWQSSWPWGSNVTRAAPFYDKRRLHEVKVESQVIGLRVAEEKVAEARKRVVALRHAAAMATPRTSVESDLDRGTLLDSRFRDFEIEGGEPGNDEFMSLDGSDDDMPRDLTDP